MLASLFLFNRHASIYCFAKEVHACSEIKMSDCHCLLSQELLEIMFTFMQVKVEGGLNFFWDLPPKKSRDFDLSSPKYVIAN